MMNKYSFGVDIGGTSIKIGFFQKEGKLLHKWEIPTRTKDQGQWILEDLSDAIFKELDERNLSISDVEGVGVGVPGPILSGGTVNGCINLGWGIKNVKQELSSLLDDIPVYVGNDANVAALGEYWIGGGKGFKDVVMVTLGTGVGGGVILNGKIISGYHGAGGEIGHIHVEDQEMEPCNCGNKGCLEQYASASGIVKKAKLLLIERSIPSVLRGLEKITCKDIFDAAKTGDAIARETIEFMGEKLGLALSFISTTIDPEVFVIGGGVSKAGQIVIDTIQKHYKKTAFHSTQDTHFKLAVLENDAGMYGAMKMVMDQKIIKS